MDTIDNETELSYKHRADMLTSRPGWITRGRIPCLDGFRAFAILAVILNHIQLASQIDVAFLSKLPFLGHLGVTCFFVISGFLITLLMLRETSRTGKISLKEFYIRRSLRILPAYLSYLSVIAVLAGIGIVNINKTYWAAALTYTMCYMSVAKAAWCVGHLWSLSVEEHFYLLWPFLFRFLRPARSMQLVLCYILVTPIIRYVVWSKLGHFIDIDFCSLTQMSSIAMGCLLAFIVIGTGLPRVETWFRERSHLVALTGVLLFCISLLAHASGKYTIMLSDPVNATALGIAMMGILYCEKSFVARLLNSKMLVVIGVLSYSLYLWQQPFALVNVLARPWYINILVLAIVSVISYKFIESPFLRLKARHATSQ